MEFSSEEYCEMMIIYGECDRNANAAARMYQERFPARRHPSANVILRLINRARNTGNLNVRRQENARGAQRRARMMENEEAVLGAIEENPTMSIRTVSRMFNLSRMTTHRILKNDNNMHAYHFSRVQNLIPPDNARRVNFCRWLLERHDANPRFIENIMFTDESIFTRDGTFNSHNYHFWAEENPHQHLVRSFQHRFSINLWAGIHKNTIVSTYYCKNNKHLQ